ncbi:MAG: Fe(3+) ABC transporter substrate-binding protein [Hyphomicrobiales bacterium]|nr:Fe(3+) ABC transporter substrate-binding protein [Hyphomicrobiales bacterium]
MSGHRTLKIFKSVFAVSGIAMTLIISSLSAKAADEVNIYSYRQAELIAPLLEKFTMQTGIRTNVLFLKKGLVDRVKAEGVNSPADLILTVDIGRLNSAKTSGVTRPVQSAIIAGNTPAEYRDPSGHWFGVTTRARVIFASKERVLQNKITYEELVDPKWKGRICTRSGQHSYNIGLFASMIVHHGEGHTEKWLRGVKANLARKPQGNDRAQAKAIFAGECDLGIGNTYYVGKMQTNEKKPEQKEWAASMKVLFPNVDGRGSHVNISGMAMAKHAPNADNARKLMEFLSSGAAQEIYAEVVFEYPVKPGTKTSDLVRRFGELISDKLSLQTIAENRKAASRLVDKVGYNDGPTS